MASCKGALPLVWAVLFFLASMAVAQVGCGPAKCYPNGGLGCLFAPMPVDYVFFVDVSNSMRTKINAVTAGLTRFSNYLVSQNIDATYTVWDVAMSNSTAISSGDTKFGPRLRLSTTRDIAAFQSLMTNGFVLKSTNLRESFFEALRMAMGIAPFQNENTPMSWREGASRVFVLLTDEDNDPPEFTSNIVGGMNNSIRSTCYSDLVAQSRWSAYQAEIDTVSNALVSNKISTYILANPWGSSDTSIANVERCLTEYQYGSPSLQSQNSDLSGFNSSRTLANLLANEATQNSLQAKLLGNNVMSRVIDINSVLTSSFVTSFFNTLADDPSTCSSCFIYKCASNGTCLAPVNICGCDGVPYSGKVTDCKGICGGGNEKSKDCNNEDTCRLPTSNVYTDCSGKCYDPLDSSRTLYATDVCGSCVVSGTTGTTYQSSCYPKPFTDPSHCTDFTCGDYCVTTGTICLTDCNGNRYPAAMSKLANGTTSTITPMYQKNDCGRCVLSSDLASSNAADKDLCGVCTNVPNYDASKCIQNCQNNYVYDPLNSTLYDACGVRCGTNCTLDCLGISFVEGNTPENTVNSCGACVPTASLSINTTTDSCGQCTNRADYAPDLCQVDCNGVYRYPLNASSLNDKCGVRCGQACMQDCAGSYYVNGTTPQHSLNRCGYCVKTEVADKDTTLLDACGICNNTIGYNAAYCQVDCSGVHTYFPNGNISRLLDSCGVRCGSNARDLCGVCGGPVGALNVDWQYQQCGCVNGTPIATKVHCGLRYCVGDPELEKECQTVVTCQDESSCGECLDPQNGVDVLPTLLIDQCGVCYPANKTALRNQNMTSCGICFGSESDCNRCDSTSLCTVTPITSTPQCGNNILEENEECDAGPFGNSTCSSSCLIIAGGSNTGVVAAAVGGSIGGALVFAGAIAAFFYAKKNGLLGVSTQTINLPTTTNPLYKSPVQSSSNPIYNEGSEMRNPAFREKV